ncbi:hypothetical protein [Bosea vestrisii]|uniref:Phosphoribosyltransferase domain-containing protein n=1 Tax=Bosea vestrisii TaxID=151416 RepID=A0ABW0HKH7_9HYPH
MDALDQLLTNGLNKTILLVLTLSSLFLVLEVSGILPRQLSSWINRNRLNETIRLLKEFGVDVETARRVNNVSRFESISGKDLSSRVKSRLKEIKLSHPVTIGTQIVVPGNHYIDLMGAASDWNTANMYARDITALWRQLAGVGGPIANTKIDFIVTPKTGSPLLGAAVAELLGKPLLLHNPKPKFGSTKLEPRAFFDCREVPAIHARALIVDDSSTGGGKAAQLVEEIRRCGWQVSDFLVIFEPQLKTDTKQNAAERLRPMGITIHSIVKT